MKNMEERLCPPITDLSLHIQSYSPLTVGHNVNLNKLHAVLIVLLKEKYFSSIFFISFHNFLLYFPNLFTIRLAFLPYFPYLFTIRLAFLPYFPYHFTFQLTFLPYFSLFNLAFFHIFHIFSLFNLAFFDIFHIFSLFNLAFFHIFHNMKNMEEKYFSFSKTINTACNLFKFTLCPTVRGE
jgi:hypothetical protein